MNAKVASRQLADEKRLHGKAVEDLKTEIAILKRRQAVSKPPDVLSCAGPRMKARVDVASQVELTDVESGCGNHFEWLL